MKSASIFALRKSGESSSGVSAQPLPLPRGRLLYVGDVRALLREGKSVWWIKRYFAPEHRFKIGRDTVWYEADALGWLDAKREGK